MTDRIRTVTVFLDKDYRDDDVQVILDTLKMIKGVEYVEPQVVKSQDHDNRIISTLEMRRKVFEALDAALSLFPKS